MSKDMSANKIRLIVSTFTMLIVLGMLVATTYAWFTTSTASCVNVIKAGNMNVSVQQYDVESGTWIEVNEKSLQWMNSNNAKVTKWMPGNYYHLPKMRIVSKDDSGISQLPFRYEVRIEGLNEEQLKEAVKFSVSVANPADKTNQENVILDTSCILEDNTNSLGQVATTGNSFVTTTGFSGSFEAGEHSQKFVISGKMNSNADNSYMNRSWGGIKIIVSATQIDAPDDSEN